MKKLLLFVMTAVLLIAPLQGVALAEEQEAARTAQIRQTGSAPAETTAAESMAPAIHAVVLAMLSRDTAVFDSSDGELAGEALYNMLSLYGQMDDRSNYVGERLLVTDETAADFAAALAPGSAGLDVFPDGLEDRVTRAPEGYLLACGSDDLADLRLDGAAPGEGGCLELTGELTYLVDGTPLARFQAELRPCDNMFGYVIGSLTLA